MTKKKQKCQSCFLAGGPGPPLAKIPGSVHAESNIHAPLLLNLLLNFLLKRIKCLTKPGLQIFFKIGGPKLPLEQKKNGGSFSEMMGPGISNQAQLTFG